MSMRTLIIDGNKTLREDGTVLGERGRPLKHRIDSNGYPAVRLRDNWKRVHQLLAEAYLPKPEGAAQVNHKDGDKTNNDLSNLEWVTQRENLHHAMDNDLHNWGRKAVRLTHIKTGEVREYLSQTDAAKDIGGAQANLSHCILGKRPTWMGFTAQEVTA